MNETTARADAGSQRRFDVVVVGSANTDHTVTVERLPHPGETILGSSYRTGTGGKGANQALAAAGFGASTALVCRLGPDAAGKDLRARLAGQGVHCPLEPGELPTGVALILVTAGGENAIVVNAGANDELRALDVAETPPAAVVLAQLEIPLDAVAAAGRRPGLFLLNPAPARPLPADLLAMVDILIPNRSELAGLLGCSEPAGIVESARRARQLAEQVPVVVATLGGDGAVLTADGAVWHQAAPQVDVVDTTGAGDAFCGVFAACLAEGMGLADAVRLAVAAGSLAATVPGASQSVACRDRIEHLASTLPAPSAVQT